MDKFTENLTEGLRKFAYAGMGAISYTVEKSKNLIDQLIARGEVTAAEGAAACGDIQKKLTEQVNAFTAKLRADYENTAFEHMLERCDALTAEQKALLIERLTAAPKAEEEICSDTSSQQTDAAEPSDELSGKPSEETSEETSDETSDETSQEAAGVDSEPQP